MKNKSLDDINNDPKIIEEQLVKLLKKYGINKKLTMPMVKRWIYTIRDKNLESIHILQKKFLSYFPKTKDIDELNEILQIFTEAWNAFPHLALNGKSPNEMVRQQLKKNTGLEEKNDSKMPDMIVGGQKMAWDEYWDMIRKMEELQIPFKNWTEEEVLPKYEKYLKSIVSQTRQKQHYEVADIFFERVRHVGFLELEQIRKDFIQKEFPRWWQTHVLDSNLDKRQVLTSLKKLFDFLELVYEIQIEKFGF